MTIVNIHEAKSQLSALIQKVENGEEVTIARNNKPVVTLVKFKKKKTREGFGSMKGQVIEHSGCWDSDLEVESSFYQDDLEG